MHSNDHQLNSSEKQQKGYCVVCLGQSGGAYKTSLLVPKELAYCPQSQCGIVAMAGSRHNGRPSEFPCILSLDLGPNDGWQCTWDRNCMPGPSGGEKGVVSQWPH